LPTDNPFPGLFAKHRSARITELWGWQADVLEQYASVGGDVAVELPTGTGKTLVGLLAGENFRESTGAPVAYLAGNKQLAQQIERQARDLGFAVVRFQGNKDYWDQRDVRSYNFGQSIGVMNYWNYFNSSPGVEPAGMLVLDDVHLLEGPLRDLFTVSLGKDEEVCQQVLGAIVSRCPYYTLAEDLVNGVEPMRPPEMLVFGDSADLADEVRGLLDARLVHGSEAWWAWQRIRSRLETCCWLVSVRGVSFTPYIPPTQTLRHFEQPARRLYLSATVGSVDDLQRRLGTPPLVKLTSTVQPRQGDRMIVMRNDSESLGVDDLIGELKPFLERYPKALWLCARRQTAKALEFTLIFSGLRGHVRRLEGDNGADEPFAAEEAGHLVVAGRYDGMDFPGDTCRVEVIPEVPVATSDLEEFVSAYLRDAPFAEARFAQRVAQALGRCNRLQDDRAVYILTDPEFVGRFSQRRSLDALPSDVRDDVYAGLERSDRGFSVCLDEADRFLAGYEIDVAQAPPPRPAQTAPSTGREEVAGMLALWREDYWRSAKLFDSVATALSEAREHRAFWLAMRALTLQLAAGYGDKAADTESKAALRAAATAGASSTFFTRLRLSEARRQGVAPMPATMSADDLFSAWDRLIDRLGPQGPRFERWENDLLGRLRSGDHDAVARSIAQVGSEVLGLAAEARQPRGGEEDVYWNLPLPRRTLAFEVKLAPTSQRITNRDVEQAEGAARALESTRGQPTRSLLITPHGSADTTAEARLERVRLMRRDVFGDQAARLIGLLREYRRGWSSDSATRAMRRLGVEAELPQLDWLWQAVDASDVWVEPDTIDTYWRGKSRI
jgi:hypothetical protein